MILWDHVIIFMQYISTIIGWIDMKFGLDIRCPVSVKWRWQLRWVLDVHVHISVNISAAVLLCFTSWAMVSANISIKDNLKGIVWYIGK